MSYTAYQIVISQPGKGVIVGKPFFIGQDVQIDPNEIYSNYRIVEVPVPKCLEPNEDSFNEPI